MTVAALWAEDSYLFAAADTRVSQDAGATRRTDSGPKLLAVPVVTRSLVNWPGLPNTYRRTLGALVIGDVAPALLTISSASTLLASLTSLDGKPPTLEQVSDYVAKIGTRLSRDYLNSTSGGYGNFSLVLLGACPRDEVLAAFHIQGECREDDSFVMISTECDLSGVSAYGSGEARFEVELQRLRQDGDEAGRASRLPIVAIENMIADRSSRDVGGTPSVGWVSEGGDFTVGWRLRPVVDGAPEAERVLNGFVLDDLGGVGACIVGREGLA